MKKLFIIITAILSAVSCANLDEVWEELREHEERIEKLETECRRLSSNIEAVQTVLEAIQKNDYATAVTKIMEDGVEVGYSITFAQSGTIEVYNRNDKYATPQFRVADGVWFVSFDEGHTWMEFGGFEEDEEYFTEVTYDDDNVYFTLTDGTVLTVPYQEGSRIIDLFIFMGQSNMVGRGVAAKAPAVPEGWGYEYKAISAPGKLSHMVEPFGLDEENSKSGVVDNRRSGSLVSAFTNAYYEKTQTPVVGVSCSKGGTTTSFWKPGGKPLNDAISRWNEAEEWLTENGYTIRHKYMFWLQGETDATNKLPAATYRESLLALVREMLSKTSVEKCIMVRVGKLGQTVSSAITICDYVIDIQTDLCRTYKEFVMGSTAAAGFVEEGLMAEYWHYTQEGYNLLGELTGLNVAYYATNGIEPHMYDPHTKDLYYPTIKYQSIFDDIQQEEDDEVILPPDFDLSNTKWYIDHTKNGAKFSSSCNVDGRGWALSNNNSIYKKIIGKPINTVAFFTNKMSQKVTVMKIASKGATTGEVIATVTATTAGTGKQLAVIQFPEVTLKSGEFLSLFSQEDNDIQFYYATVGVNDSVSGDLDSKFYSRLPVVYGSGTAWGENAMSLGWSYGYTTSPDDGSGEGSGSGDGSGEVVTPPTQEDIQTTWYIDHTGNASKFTSSCNIEGRGWAISDNNDVYKALIGKPINTAAFFTNKRSQNVTVMKIASKGATTGEVIANVTATTTGSGKQLATIQFPDVTLKSGEYLSLFSQEDKNIQFYYSASSVKDSATGEVDQAFYSRLPILYGTGTAWAETPGMSLGWSFGYTPPHTTYFSSAMTIEEGISNLRFTGGYAALPSAANGFVSNYKGRATTKDCCLKVNGGETLELAAGSVPCGFSIVEFTDIPLSDNTLTATGEKAGRWLTSATLQKDTKYILINFRRDETSETEFSEEELNFLNGSLTFK